MLVLIILLGSVVALWMTGISECLWRSCSAIVSYVLILVFVLDTVRHTQLVFDFLCFFSFRNMGRVPVRVHVNGVKKFSLKFVHM